MRFLGFRLYAPLSSFGDVAVGAQRPSLSAPTRSMLLGIVGACLGIRRDDEGGQFALDSAFGVATRTDADGTLLIDYHTAQVPDAPRLGAFRTLRGYPPATRRDELSAKFDRTGAPHALGTQLTQRQYRTDAAFAACVWLREQVSPWALEDLAERMRQPIFVPYAGRKTAVLGLPFEPQLIEASNPVAALRQLAFSLDESLRAVTRASTELTYRWEGDWPDLSPERTETRRDRVASRARWQFVTRDEHVLTEPKEAADVLEPDRARS